MPHHENLRIHQTTFVELKNFYNPPGQHSPAGCFVLCLLLLILLMVIKAVVCSPARRQCVINCLPGAPWLQTVPKPCSSQCGQGRQLLFMIITFDGSLLVPPKNIHSHQRAVNIILRRLCRLLLGCKKLFKSKSVIKLSNRWNRNLMRDYEIDLKHK